MLIAYLVATAFVAVAELGDKTQMLTLVLAVRYRAWQVLLGVTVAVLALQALAVGVGATVGCLVPDTVLGVVTGVLFVGFGVWSLWSARSGTDDAEIAEEASRAARFGPVLGVAAAFFLAEFGDKTQLLTMSIAADPGAAARTLALFTEAPSIVAGTPETLLAVWLGSTTGMLLVNGLVVLLGAAIGTRMPPRVVARVSGAVFIGFGLVTLGVTSAGL